MSETILHQQNELSLNEHLLTKRWGVPIGVHAVKFDKASLQENYLTTEERMSRSGNIESYYAGRIAAKVAVMKLFANKFPWSDILITSMPTGQPVVELRGETLEQATQNGIGEIPVSISHDDGWAVAIAAGNPRTKVGVDITSTKRIEEKLKMIRTRVFTCEEIDEASKDPFAFACMLAGKEATSKALGTGIWSKSGVTWKDISILSRDDGIPYILLAGAAKHQAENQKITHWDICYAGDENNPIAFVIGGLEEKVLYHSY